MQDAIRYGFVGTGGIARGAHIRAIQALQLGTITAVSDTHPATLEKGRAPFCDAKVGKASVLIGLAGETAARENCIVEISEVA